MTVSDTHQAGDLHLELEASQSLLLLPPGQEQVLALLAKLRLLPLRGLLQLLLDLGSLLGLRGKEQGEEDTPVTSRVSP